METQGIIYNQKGSGGTELLINGNVETNLKQCRVTTRPSYGTNYGSLIPGAYSSGRQYNPMFTLITYKDLVYALNWSTNPTSNYEKSYTWNGTEWNLFETTNTRGYSGTQAVEYHGKLYLFGGNMMNYTDRNAVCTWDGENFIQLENLPVQIYGSNAIVYKDKIHIFGGYYTSNRHFTYDEENGLQELATMDYSISSTSNSTIIDDQIHVFSTNIGKHIYWDEESNIWRKVESFDLSVSYSTKIIKYNGILYTATTTNDATNNGVFCYKNSTWQKAAYFSTGVIANNKHPQIAKFDNKIMINGGYEVIAWRLRFPCETEFIY